MLLLAVLAALQTGAAAQTAGWYEVKAAFLYNFARFIEWPPEVSDVQPCIGILGKDPFGPVLDQMVRATSINGRRFVIRRFKTGQEPGDCRILFISSSEQKRLREILQHLWGRPVLTVGDMPGFCESGGMIDFDLADDRVRFEVNVQAAEQARLEVSCKLLAVARIFHGSNP
jgi:hypothetical protein